MTKWTERPLATLVAVQKGRKVSTFEYRADGCAPYLGAEVISGGSPSEYADPEGAILAEELDVLMLWDGERSGLVGKGRLGIVSSTAARLSPREMIDSGFLFYSLDARFEWIQGRRTGTGVPHVPKDLGRILHLTYPTDLKEQRRIAEILSTVDVAIEGTEKLIAKHQQIKAGLMHDLFTRGLTPDGHLRPPHAEAPHLYKDSPLGPMPKEWDVGKLSRFLIGRPRNGFSPPEVSQWDGVYSLGLGCLTLDGFRPRQMKYVPADSQHVQGAILHDGDLLLSRSNTRELVGLCGIYSDVGEPCIYPDLMMRLRANHRISPGMLEAILLTPLMRRQIAAAAVGTSGSMVKLNAGSVLNLDVAVPKEHEQSMILSAVKGFRASLVSLEHDAGKLGRLKRGLMHDLLTGRVPVPIPEAEDHA